MQLPHPEPLRGNVSRACVAMSERSATPAVRRAELGAFLPTSIGDSATTALADRAVGRGVSCGASFAMQATHLEA